MIFKILIVGVLVYIAYRLYIGKKNGGKNIEEIEDTLVECPSCGTFIAKDEAILSNGRYYCSQKCLNHK